MVDVRLADERYWDRYGVPFNHDRNSGPTFELWNEEFQAAQRDPSPERRAPHAARRREAEEALWELEDRIGRAVSRRPPPVVQALLKGQPTDQRSPVRDKRRRDTTTPRLAWQRAAGALMAYTLGRGCDPNSVEFPVPSVRSAKIAHHMGVLESYHRDTDAALDGYRLGIGQSR